MMSYLQINVHPEAVAEARAAFEWYRKRSDSAGNAFLAEIDYAIERISQGPDVWPPYFKGTRRFFCSAFHYDHFEYIELQWDDFQRRRRQ